jgi:hypothetical protein
MAIRPLSTIDVDVTRLEFKSLGTSPKKDFETGVQQTDRLTDAPLWSVDVLVSQADGSTATSTVTVPAKDAPSIPLLTQLSFTALRASTFGSAGLLLRADAVLVARSAPQGRGE